MATHGKNTRVKLQSPTDGTLTDISVFGKDSTLSRSVDTAETSHFGSQAKEYVVGQSDATFTVSGNFERAQDAQFAKLMSLQQTASVPALPPATGTGETMVIEYAPEGYRQGAVGYRGSYIMTGYDVSGSVGDLVSASLNFQRSGDNVRGTYAANGTWTADS